MIVLMINKLLSTAIDKIMNLAIRDQRDRCRRVIGGFFVYLDRYENNGKLIGWKTRFRNRQSSEKGCPQSNCRARVYWVAAFKYFKSGSQLTTICKILNNKTRRTFTDESSIKEENLH